MPIFDSSIFRRIQTPTDAEWQHVQEAVNEERQEADRIGRRARRIL